MQYAYDTLDNLTCVVQKGTDTAAFTSCAAAPAAWRPRSFTYNSLSQLTQASNPESGAISYTYGADGNLLTKTDARSITTTHAYDALHRLNKKTYSDATPLVPLVRYAYDGVAFETCNTALSTANAIGRRTAMCDAAGSESWAYDLMGRVLADRRTTNGVPKDFAYQYNLDGSLWKLTYPSGRIITYSYNAAARLTAAQDVAGGVNYATGASYAAGGALMSLNNGASIVSTYYYNNRLQPCRISVKSSGTAPSNCTDATNVGNILDFGYGFTNGQAQNNGNVASIANNRAPERSQSFTYDELNRIKTAQSQASSGAHCWGLQFGYDIWANLLSASVTKCSAPTLSQSVGTNNRLSGYSYDAVGNMLSDGSFSYTWDAESRMKTGAGVTYTYDGDGRRVKKSNGKLYWYGPGLDALLETDLAGNNPDEYIFFGGKRVARRQLSGAVSYYFSDHLGSSRVVASASGSVLDDSDFYPFGGERIVASSSGNHYKFTGKERDPESNLDYFGARYFASSLGRYFSPDWSEIPQPVPYADFNNPQTLNLFAYVANNPMNSTDPDGHCPDFLSCATQVVVGATQGMANFATHVVSGLLTPARLSNGDLASNPSEVTQAVAEGVAQSVITATQDYASGQAAASFNALDAQGQMAVVTEAVLTGASAVAPAAKGSGGPVREGIYEGADATVPGRVYVGQSENLPRRLGEQKVAGKFPEGTKTTTREVRGGKTAREIAEHKRINELGGVRSVPGSKTSNVRNPIGKARKHLLKDPEVK